MNAIVAVFGSSQTRPHDPEYADARSLGAALARAGFGVATGGYAGTMEAVSEGAASEGGHVIGITAPTVFPGRAGANRFVDREVAAATISERIHRLVDLANAHVALPGSLGTVTELLVAWNDGHVAPFAGRSPKPLVAVGTGWAPLIDLLSSMFGADASAVHQVASVDEVVPHLSSLPGLA